jgi:Cytochrome P450
VDSSESRLSDVLSHAFSERALREQEYLPLAYIDLLIRRLCEAISSSEDGCAVVDMVQWFNFTTVDIVGDLAMEESFNCLEESKYHGWVSILFTQFKVAALFVSLRFFGLDKLLKVVIPTSLLKQRAEHANTANERIHRRLDYGAKGTDAKGMIS